MLCNPFSSDVSLLLQVHFLVEYCKTLFSFAFLTFYLKNLSFQLPTPYSPWTCNCAGEHCIIYPSLVLWGLCWNLRLKNMKILTVTGSSAQTKSLEGCRRPDAAFRMWNTSFSIYMKHSLANIDNPQTADNLHATHYRTYTRAITRQHQPVYLLVSLKGGFSNKAGFVALCLRGFSMNIIVWGYDVSQLLTGRRTL